MTLDHAATHYATPAQWADDWLTPTERKALRAIEASPWPHTRRAPGNTLSVQPRAIPTRSKLSRVVQRACQTIAWSLIGLAIVGLSYIACCMAWALSAR